MNEQTPTHSFEEAQEEANKMMEDVAYGKAKDYTEAAKRFEVEKLIRPTQEEMDAVLNEYIEAEDKLSRGSAWVGQGEEFFERVVELTCCATEPSQVDPKFAEKFKGWKTEDFKDVIYRIIDQYEINETKRGNKFDSSLRSYTDRDFKELEEKNK